MEIKNYNRLLHEIELQEDALADLDLKIQKKGKKNVKAKMAYEKISDDLRWNKIALQRFYFLQNHCMFGNSNF